MRRRTMLLLIPTFLITSALAHGDTIGDVNSDGKVDLTEAIYALQVVTGNAQEHTTNSIIGAWWDGSTSTDVGRIMVIVFFDDGTYIHVQNGDEVNANWNGYEYGTYTYADETKVLVPTPLVDMNGEVGLSHLEGQMTVDIADDIMTVNIVNDDGPGTFYRVK